VFHDSSGRPIRASANRRSLIRCAESGGTKNELIVDAESCSNYQETRMPDDPSKAPRAPEPLPATAHGLPLVSALILSIVAGAVAIVGSVAVVKGTMPNSTKAAISVLSLVALLVLAYALIQLLLAVIATAGERRWFARQISERRQGDRARKPRDS